MFLIRNISKNAFFSSLFKKANDISQLQDDYLNEITIINENPNDCTKLTKTFSNSLDDINSEFTTPISDDKRSKSLISLRRRHWSASSSRSTSTNFIANKSTAAAAASKTKFVNNDDRNKKRVFTNKSNNNRSTMNNSVSMPTLTDDDEPNQPPKVYKYKLKENISSNEYRTRQNTLYNKGNVNLNSTTRSMNLRKRPNAQQQQQQQQPLTHKKSLNTSVSAIMGINKLSKSLRKSLNDIYTPSSNQHHQQRKRGEEASKENNNNKASPDKKTNRYVKRLKCFKDRLIQTKNNLLNRKRKLFDTTTSKDQFNLTLGNKSTRKSKSQFDFSDYQKSNKTFQSLYGNYRDNCEYDEDDLEENEEEADDDYENENYYDRPTFDDEKEPKSYKENQSFVVQFKSKLNYMKKSRTGSQKANNLTCNGDLMMDAKNELAFQSKRPKFY